jgi:hypothetical protein
MSTKCTGGKAKTLELMHLLLLDMGVSSQPADEAHIVCLWTDELFIQQKSVSDGDHSQSLSHFLPHLLNMRQPGQLCIKGHSHERAVLTQ